MELTYKAVDYAEQASAERVRRHVAVTDRREHGSREENRIRKIPSWGVLENVWKCFLYVWVLHIAIFQLMPTAPQKESAKLEDHSIFSKRLSFLVVLVQSSKLTLTDNISGIKVTI